MKNARSADDQPGQGAPPLEHVWTTPRPMVRSCDSARVGRFWDRLVYRERKIAIN